MRRLLGSLGLLALIAPAASAQGGVSSFCTPGANGATLSATGSTDFAVNNGSGDLVLHAQGVPAGALGLFLQGNLQVAPIPVGNGFLCVGGSTHVFRHGALTSGPSGGVSYPLDYLAPPAAGATITPGSTWNFQLWFRDGASSDLSDALQVQFVPPTSLGAGTPIYASFRSGHPLGQIFEGGALVIGDDAEFQAFWAQHAAPWTPPPPPPQVDFTQVTVIAVFAGHRLTSGYSITVRDVAQSVTTLDVESIEVQPGPGCGVFYSETNPMQLVTVPRVPSAVLGTWTANTSVHTCP